MIAFDTSFLTLLFVPDAPHSITNAKQRVEFLISDIHGSGERIVIPTPALSEILVRSGSAKNDIIQTLTKSPKFLVAPFDIRSALELSIMTDAAFTKKDKRAGAEGTWVKITLDRQIVAISKTFEARAIYSEDHNVRAIATREGLATYSVEDIKIPEPSQGGFWKPQ
jgi:predicted nucleic acid-binding protein